MSEIENMYSVCMKQIISSIHVLEQEQQSIDTLKLMHQIFNESKSVRLMEQILNLSIGRYTHLITTFSIHTSNPLTLTTLRLIKKRLDFLMTHRCYSI